VRRLVSLALGLALTAGLFGGPVLAGRQMGLVLSSYGSTQGGPNSPPYCMSEDDGANWMWYGSMAVGESLTQTFVLCDRTLDGVDAGSISFYTLIQGPKGTYRLTVRDPFGQVWPAHAMTLRNPYAGQFRCVTEYEGGGPNSVAVWDGDIDSGHALDGGTWSVTFENIGDRPLRATTAFLYVANLWSFWTAEVQGGLCY